MKSSSLRLFVAVIAILAFTVACSLPFVISPVQPAEKIVYVEITSHLPPVASTSAPTATVSRTCRNSCRNPMPLQSIWMDHGLSGRASTNNSWILISCSKDISLVGNTATDDGQSLLFKGTISQDSKERFRYLGIHHRYFRHF